jgi:hypothetical protein
MLPGGGGSEAYYARVNQPTGDEPSPKQLLLAVGLVSK